jgi:transposase-like protein
LQTWVAGTRAEVVVAYAATLAAAIPPVAVRLGRHFPTLITLIRAHALLHQLYRVRDADGRVLASFADYAIVRDLVADLIADGAERAVSMTVRETVRAVRELTVEYVLEEGVTVVAVAHRLGIDKSSASRRVRVAIDRGFVRNLEDHRGRPARLVVGDALADDAAVLPTVAELERLHGCSLDAGDVDLPIELDYPASAWATDAPSTAAWNVQ